MIRQAIRRLTAFWYTQQMAGMTYTTDTSPEAEAIQLDLLRQMTPEQRILKMCSLSQSVKKMAFDAIRRQHPEYSAEDVRLAFIELNFGKSLADDVRRWTQEASL
jgi:hypothetical protein